MMTNIKLNGKYNYSRHRTKKIIKSFQTLKIVLKYFG